MNTKEAILVVCFFSLLIVVPVFSLQFVSSHSNNAAGKITIADDNGGSVDFKAVDGKDGQPSTGYLRLKSGDGSKETEAEVKYVNVDGDYAWFAGQCTRDSGGLTGRWFFAAVHDGGTPGKLVDHIWFDWLPDTADAEAVAKSKVENFAKPSSNKPITTGDIVVTFSD